MNNLNRYAGTLLSCISELLIGILLLINPLGFTSVIIIVLGIVLTILGIISVVTYFRTEPKEASRKNGLANGLLLILLGLFCIFKAEWFIVTFPVLTIFYGILTLISGISKIQWTVDMLRTKQEDWFVTVISTFLTLMFAILILCNPFASTAIHWKFIAVTQIIEAAVDLIIYVFGIVRTRQ